MTESDVVLADGSAALRVTAYARDGYYWQVSGDVDDEVLEVTAAARNSVNELISELGVTLVAAEVMKDPVQRT